MLAWMLALVAAAGCAATEEAPRDSPPRSEVVADAGLRLAPDDSTVRTVQLYAGADERRLPVFALGTGAALTLEFDVLGAQGRPLSVHFYHADRNWEPDPAPARYLSGFRSDELLDYTLSRAEGVRYVHYVYRFPARNIGFRMSGNYLVRVTEQGDPDAVLFERPFFVAEEVGALEMSLDDLRLGTQLGRSDRPALRYRPPARLSKNAFDYSACFVPGGRLGARRCVERPSLASEPLLVFELPYRESFSAGTADFFLDLSRLQPGGEIAAADQQATPYRVTLETDRAEFAGTDRGPLLNAQTVVRRAGLPLSDPEVSGAYAAVRFRFVPPDGRRLPGPVHVTGSFHAGPAARAPRLRWRAAVGYYEGVVLLKQGLYEYHYTSPDARVRDALAQTLGRARRRYAALVYYRNSAFEGDRLLMVREAEAE